jgi:hypothetical protein
MRQEEMHAQSGSTSHLLPPAVTATARPAGILRYHIKDGAGDFVSFCGSARFHSSIARLRRFSQPFLNAWAICLRLTLHSHARRSKETLGGTIDGIP